MVSERDMHLMRQAILEGEKGRINAPPNPWVGCIIVKDNEILGKGYHEAAGRPHAEAVALQAAGPAAKGATAYITLEPCSHHGKTPPCAHALIAAGIGRVVIALQDPDPKVNGKGIFLLRQAGIPVDVGILAAEAARSLEPYLHHRKTGNAFCVAKAAMSLDGRTAAADGSSKWITTPAARKDSHRLRADSQAILIGTGTAVLDRPLLTVREGILPYRQPLRVVLDTSGKMQPDNPLCDVNAAPTLVLTSEKCPPKAIQDWKNAGVEVGVLPLSRQGKIHPQDVVRLLGERGVLQVLVEGGSTVLGNFMEAGVINRLVVYVGPRILGDSGAPLFKYLDYASIDAAPTVKLIDSQTVEQNVRLTFEI